MSDIIQDKNPQNLTLLLNNMLGPPKKNIKNNNNNTNSTEINTIPENSGDSNIKNKINNNNTQINSNLRRSNYAALKKSLGGSAFAQFHFEKNILRNSIKVSNLRSSLIPSLKSNNQCAINSTINILPQTRKNKIFYRTMTSVFQQEQNNNNFNINNNEIYDIYEMDKSDNLISYDDLYFEDDMFIPSPPTYPDEDEEDFLLKLKFIEENNFDEDLNMHEIRNNSFSYKINSKDNIHLKYLNRSSKSNKSVDESFKSKNLSNVYVEEKEEEGKNILYINNNSTDNNYNKYEDWKKLNKNYREISYMSLNLFIKKVAVEYFCNYYPILYKCFLDQFKYFLPIPLIIEKIINAFDFYKKSINLNSSNLLTLMNKIIFTNLDAIKGNHSEIIPLITTFYKKINDLVWDNPYIYIDIETILYLLNNNEVAEDEIYYTKKLLDVDKFNDIIVNEDGGQIKTKSSFNNKTMKRAEKFEEKRKKKEEERERKLLKHRYFNLFSYSEEEIAAYLACVSYELLSKITLNEFFDKNFNKKNRYQNSPNIVRVIDRFDKMIFFIIEDIFSYDDKEVRAELITKWLNIALKCKEFNNFNDMLMINTCFCNYLFKRLHKTWKKLNKKTRVLMSQLNKFCSGHQCYINIRRAIFNVKGAPYVPYLGILLKEIMNIEEMKYLIDDNNINFAKMMKLENSIEHFFEFKCYKYQFNKKSKTLEILEKINPKSEEELEFLAQKLEPNPLISSVKGIKKRQTRTDVTLYGKSEEVNI